MAFFNTENVLKNISDSKCNFEANSVVEIFLVDFEI